MSDPEQLLDRALASSRNRRRAAQAIAATAGSLLLIEATTRQGSRFAFAQDDDDDSSGRGRGRGGDDHDNSGPGNADDPDEEPALITGQVPDGAIEIRIVSDDSGGFVPGELTVDLGQTVAFVNAHDDEHTATGSGFDTGVIAPGEFATVVLDTAGAFAYACQIHPVMTGRISVRGEDGVVPETQATAPEIPADATTVRIANLAFDPVQITIATGTTVSWSNEDSVPHTVTATDGAFDSGIFDPGANFTWTFAQPGSFPYACQLHPQMQGTVIAEGEAVTSASSGPATESQNEPTAEADSTPSARPAIEETGPEGVWLIQLTPDGESILGGHRALMTFHDDGTAEADFAAESGDGSPIMVLTSGRGEWLLQVQGTVCRISLIALMNDTAQRFAGTAIFEAEAQLDLGSRVLDGTFDFAVVDAAGQSLGDGSGTLRGEAVPLDPSLRVQAGNRQFGVASSGGAVDAAR